MDNRRKIGDINSSLQDTLAGIRVVQSFANERIEQEKFNRSNENFLISKDANYRCMGSFMSGNVFPGDDVSCYAGIWWFFDSAWKDGGIRSCYVCAVYRYLYQSYPDTGRAD